MPALRFNVSFASVARFSQVEFLTEFSLFSLPQKLKGLISPKDFSPLAIADHALAPLRCGASPRQRLRAVAIRLGKTVPLLIYFVPDA